MNYVEMQKYIVENVKRETDFYIDITNIGKKTRIHVVLKKIGSTTWYEITPEIYKNDEYISDVTYSTAMLEELGRTAGVAYMHLRNM